MLLYKYTSRKAIESLLDGELMISKPSSFNDPFEFIPVISDYDLEQHVEARLANNDFLLHLYSVDEEQGRFSGDFGMFKTNVVAKRSYYAGRIRRGLKRSRLNGARTLRRLADDIVGVFALSFNENDILLWSHYGDNHRGAMIAFESTSFEDALPKEVTYCKARPVTSVFEQSGEEGKLGKELTRLMFTKGCCWEYEKEYRIIYNPSDCDKRKIGQKSLNFHHIPPRAVRRIVLGVDAKRGIIKAAKKLKALPEFRHVLFERAKIDATEYKIVTTPL